MKIKAHGLTNVGLVRESNEDNLLVDREHSVFAVADGVGGMPGGEVASAAAVKTLQEAINADPAGALSDLNGLVERAHRAVREAGQSFGGEGICTTLTLAHIDGESISLAHVGDSFALHVHAGQCRALTREHNIENETDDVRSLAPFPPRYRYALTRVLGQPEALVPDIKQASLALGDWLILATDGLTDLVEPNDVAGICTDGKSPEAAAEELVAAALERGGHDNITLVVVRAESD